MIEEIQALVDEYLSWLRDKTDLKKINDQWVEISTPYLDRHNDSLLIYAKRDDGGYLLTDDGETIQDLFLSGCKLESPKRRDLLEMTLHGFGVQIDETDALMVHTSRESFTSRKHNLVQAMLAVNDMFYLSEPSIKSIFLEDVAAWLDLKEIRWTSGVKFTGKTGYDHHFDFVIPKSAKQPERILRAINHPDRDSANSLVLAWIDTRETRLPDSKAYGVLNDLERQIPPAVIEAMRNYEIKPILWSKREENVVELAA